MTINLTAPDPEFKYKLAVPHAAILPASTPAERRRHEADPRHGRLLLRLVQPEQAAGDEAQPVLQAVVEAAQPDGYPDQITQSFGLTIEAQITAIENGQADWTLEAPPADRLGEIGTKYANQVHINPLTAFWYVPMNTNLPPFNNLKARQAVNYAIDRNAAVKIFGGPKLATPSCQVLPPGFPGHKRLLPVHEESRREVVGAGPRQGEAARQGVGHGGSEGRRRHRRTTRSTRRWASTSRACSTRSATRRPSSRSPQNISFTYVQNTKNKVQINVQQWYQDYPAASDFLYILFGCESFHPAATRASTSPASATRRSTRRCTRRSRSASTNEDAANALWAKIDKQVTDAVADGDAVHAEAHRLRLEAGRQLHVQQAVLLARRPVVGPVGVVVGAGRESGPHLHRRR